MQITYRIEPETNLPSSRVQAPPLHYMMGGIGGGPLICWFESESHIATYHLRGLVIEHPDYESNEFSVERIVAIRADFIAENGRIVSL